MDLQDRERLWLLEQLQMRPVLSSSWSTDLKLCQKWLVRPKATSEKLSKKQKRTVQLLFSSTKSIQLLQTEKKCMVKSSEEWCPKCWLLWTVSRVEDMSLLSLLLTGLTLLTLLWEDSVDSIDKLILVCLMKSVDSKSWEFIPKTWNCQKMLISKLLLKILMVLWELM